MKSERIVERLFSYGSLQPGASNSHVMSGISGEWQPAVVKGHLYESGWGADIDYPGLVLDESGDDVHGQLFTSASLSAHWAELDDFEGIEYERVIATVRLMNGERSRAYVYVIRDQDNLAYVS